MCSTSTLFRYMHGPRLFADQICVISNAQQVTTTSVAIFGSSWCRILQPIEIWTRVSLFRNMSTSSASQQVSATAYFGKAARASSPDDELSHSGSSFSAACRPCGDDLEGMGPSVVTTGAPCRPGYFQCGGCMMEKANGDMSASRKNYCKTDVLS